MPLGGRSGRARPYRVSVTSPQVSVLVVEDDPGIATQLVRGLERAGYTADSVAMGAEALRRPHCDVILLDLGLPDVDGMDVCRRLRADSDAAIIVVTARGEESDRVLALDEGADDYLVKPFGLAELLARIRAVLRRGQRAGSVGGQAELLRHGPLSVDLRTRRVTMSGSEIALTPKEFAILECLAADPGRLISRQEIVERAWDEHWYGPTKVLDVHLAALRRKLGDPTLIETVYGHGFRLADRPAPPADQLNSEPGNSDQLNLDQLNSDPGNSEPVAGDSPPGGPLSGESAD
jgi:DNA-binding response OmpR family regulator